MPAGSPLRLIALLGVGVLGLPGAADASGAGGASPDLAAGSSTTGGAAFGTPLRTSPVAVRFRPVPQRVRADRRPVVAVRVEEPGVRSVRARVVLHGRGKPVTVVLGRIRTGRDLRVRFPSGKRIAPGRYRIVLHVVDPDGAVLSRVPGRRGEATLLVVAPPRPKPKPRPKAPPAPVVVTPPRPGGVFPVAGPYTIGDGIGAARDGHTHQGVDIAAAEGTPVVAPTAGTIAFVDYQRKGAGWYVVQNATDGRAFFFAHCRTNSVAVSPGQTVTPGTRLCGVGQTGTATGPHLHFEIWEGGWRVDAGSHFVDPLPQLRAWAT